MANDNAACLYFGIWIYVLIRTITMLSHKQNVWWSLWPAATFTIFITTRIIESAWLNIKFYAILIVPLNILMFGAGIPVFIFCKDWLSSSMIIYIIVFSLQCIQMLIFTCICTILVVEGISLSRIARNNPDFLDEANEQLLDQGLDEFEIEDMVSNKPQTSIKGETWSIWLWEFIDDDGVMQFKNWKHVFHCGCISSWLQRSNRWPNCNTDVRNMG